MNGYDTLCHGCIHHSFVQTYPQLFNLCCGSYPKPTMWQNLLKAASPRWRSSSQQNEQLWAESRDVFLRSQPYPEQQEAEQGTDVVEGVWMPEGGAVTQIRITAVDSHPWQLLLLAVSGCSTAAGQDDPQGCWRDKESGGDSQSVRHIRVMSWCLPQQN